MMVDYYTNTKENFMMQSLRKHAKQLLEDKLRSILQEEADKVMDVVVKEFMEEFKTDVEIWMSNDMRDFGGQLQMAIVDKRKK